MNYSVLAFLDVLGFSAMVERDSQSVDTQFLPSFIDIFGKIAGEARNEISLQMFSDSIVIEAPLNPINVVKVIETIGKLQQRFLKERILLRGGVAFGKHFKNDHVMFSQALVSAYNIEKKIARFPRVVISNDLLNYAWHHQETTLHLKNELRRLLISDRDSSIFVDYLHAESLPNNRVHVENCIHAEPHPQETVLEKMRWLFDYYNFLATQAEQSLIKADHLTNGFRRLTNVP